MKICRVFNIKFLLKPTVASKFLPRCSIWLEQSAQEVHLGSCQGCHHLFFLHPHLQTLHLAIPYAIAIIKIPSWISQSCDPTRTQLVLRTSAIKMIN